MSEIEKMYNNANIKTCKRKQGFTLKDCTDRDCKECGYYDMPPFTAEKQLELIKLLGDVKDFTVEIDRFKGVYYVGCREAGSNDKYWGSHNLFEEALTECINDLWHSLTEEEKQEIKRILEEL